MLNWHGGKIGVRKRPRPCLKYPVLSHCVIKDIWFCCHKCPNTCGFKLTNVKMPSKELALGLAHFSSHWNANSCSSQLTNVSSYTCTWYHRCCRDVNMVCISHTDLNICTVCRDVKCPYFILVTGLLLLSLSGEFMAPVWEDLYSTVFQSCREISLIKALPAHLKLLNQSHIECRILVVTLCAGIPRQIKSDSVPQHIGFWWLDVAMENSHQLSHNTSQERFLQVFFFQVWFYILLLKFTCCNIYISDGGGGLIQLKDRCLNAKPGWEEYNTDILNDVSTIKKTKEVQKTWHILEKDKRGWITFPAASSGRASYKQGQRDWNVTDFSLRWAVCVLISFPLWQTDAGQVVWIRKQREIPQLSVWLIFT